MFVSATGHQVKNPKLRRNRKTGEVWVFSGERKYPLRSLSYTPSPGDVVKWDVPEGFEHLDKWNPFEVASPDEVRGRSEPPEGHVWLRLVGVPVSIEQIEYEVPF